MAFDEFLSDRINQLLETKNVEYYPKKMMGGLVFMVNEKMCIGIHIDKKLNHSLLMARIGQEQYDQVINQSYTLPMDFTGRPMKGYIYVTPDGMDTTEQLEYWIDLALNFNEKIK